MLLSERKKGYETTYIELLFINVLAMHMWIHHLWKESRQCVGGGGIIGDTALLSHP